MHLWRHESSAKPRSRDATIYNIMYLFMTSGLNYEATKPLNLEVQCILVYPNPVYPNLVYPNAVSGAIYFYPNTFSFNRTLSSAQIILIK